MTLSLNAEAFVRWSQLCVRALELTRSEIDALNVFPVPDSDTGTNAYLTFVAGADSLGPVDLDSKFSEVVKTYLDGLLMGAKGNSGVILSQLVRASFQELLVHPELEGADVARAFIRAADAAYAAVGNPVEGTILSVARSAAQGAKMAAAHGSGARETFAAAASAARIALEHTPEQMERLARAGVVDAGGRALVVVLNATEHAMTGRFVRDHFDERRPTPVPIPDNDLVEGGPAYEVMYLLDADDENIPALRARLLELGDSLVVVGGEGLWNVHIHVDDVGAAMEAGIVAGRPYRIAVTHFVDQGAHSVDQRAHNDERVAEAHRDSSRNTASAANKPHAPGRAVIAATTGGGLSTLCHDAGAQVLGFTQAEPLTVADMAGALRDSGADEIIVLPNNPRFVGLFEAAVTEARTEAAKHPGSAVRRIAVIPTHAQVQGLAALAVHDPGRAFDEDVVAMTSAAAHTQHGALTLATEPGMTMAGPCETGDVLGVVAGDFACVGRSAEVVATEVLDRLMTPATEMVTLVMGRDVPSGLGATLRSHVRQSRPEVDTIVYDGGQENYLLFVAVE